MTEREANIVLKDLRIFLIASRPQEFEYHLNFFGINCYASSDQDFSFRFIIEDGWIKEVWRGSDIASLADPEYKEKVKAYVESRKDLSMTLERFNR